MNAQKRIALIIAAHPDDEILGCGGTIAKYNDSIDFYVLILTGGSVGRYDKSMEDVFRNQAIKANEIICTKDLFFEDLPNQGLDNILLTDVISVIERYINKLNPEILFIHSFNDLNKDHRIVYEAGITAARPCTDQIVKKIYSYHVASSSEWNQINTSFLPNTFINIENTIQDKIAAIKCYTSECRPYPHPRSPEAIQTYADFWGLNVGMKSAEPFFLVRNITSTI